MPLILLFYPIIPFYSDAPFQLLRYKYYPFYRDTSVISFNADWGM